MFVLPYKKTNCFLGLGCDRKYSFCSVQLYCVKCSHFCIYHILINLLLLFQMIRNLLVLTFVVAAVAGDLLSHEPSRNYGTPALESFHPHETHHLQNHKESYDAPAPISYDTGFTWGKGTETHEESYGKQQAHEESYKAPSYAAPVQKCYPQTVTNIQVHTEIKKVGKSNCKTFMYM